MTLPASDVVNVSISLAALAAGPRSFGNLLIVGATDGVIDPQERLREYSEPTAVALDFGIDSPEYKAAEKYFGQKPKPRTGFIGRWVKSASSAVLKGAVLSTAQRDITNFTSISDGSMKITIDDIEKVVTALDLSAVTNLNGVASALTAKLGTASVTWNDVYNRFEITSLTTGISSTISYAIANATGTDVSSLMGLTVGHASVPVNGYAAEPLMDAISHLADKSLKWYGLDIAEPISDKEVLDVAAFINATSPSRIYGQTITNALALDGTSTTDLAYKLSKMNNGRVFAIFSGDTPHAAASVFGRAFSVNFNGTNTTITLKFKQLPGIQAEDLKVSQAKALKNKNCNVYAGYNNDTAILQEGVMCDGSFIDECHGLDWLQNHLETALWNLFYTTTTKVPQTEGGVNRQSTVLERALEQAVSNGLIGPGQWNGDSFGALNTGDYLSKGYYVYANSLDDQSQSERENRKSPVFQIAIKLTGATHFSDVLVSVNR
ncbi:hypothetical protein B7L44_05360 [Acinetobacter nosocomialis]|uniref:DUF3383 domain-containing protein n=1 Tax=Acinetobacter nosocomialis TaxID=106654 RepID=UPI0009E12537|nr:DUF3383 domain-containing protein [Acinetobacter nosocomialis]ARG16068.1 hypothetical protein B7L44_05360 [Acinetobacter nosocomialis]